MLVRAAAKGGAASQLAKWVAWMRWVRVPLGSLCTPAPDCALRLAAHSSTVLRTTDKGLIREKAPARDAKERWSLKRATLLPLLCSSLSAAVALMSWS